MFVFLETSFHVCFFSQFSCQYEPLIVALNTCLIQTPGYVIKFFALSLPSWLASENTGWTFGTGDELESSSQMYFWLQASFLHNYNVHAQNNLCMWWCCSPTHWYHVVTDPLLYIYQWLYNIYELYCVFRFFFDIMMLTANMGTAVYFDPIPCTKIL